MEEDKTDGRIEKEEEEKEVEENDEKSALKDDIPAENGPSV